MTDTLMVQGFAGSRRYVPESPCCLRRVGLIVLFALLILRSSRMLSDSWALGMVFGARKVATKGGVFVPRVLLMFLLEGYLRKTVCCLGFPEVPIIPQQQAPDGFDLVGSLWAP